MSLDSPLYHAGFARDINPHRGWANTIEASSVMATPTTIATSIPESLRPTEAAVDGQHAIFLYPSGAPVINNIDTIQVTYDTIWPAANLTLTCEIEPRRRLFSTATYDLGEFEQLKEDKFYLQRLIRHDSWKGWLY